MSITTQQNEWSCALACVVSLANDHGIKVTQESLSKDYLEHFPEWRTRLGLINRMDIFRLVDLVGLPTRSILVTPDRQEFIDAFARRGGCWVGGFLFVHQPSNHALRICGLNATHAEVMDPSQGAPFRGLVPWTAFDRREPEYILIA